MNYTCERRTWREDDDGFGTGPVCGKPAKWIACTERVNEKVCDEHKCRCNISCDAPKCEYCGRWNCKDCVGSLRAENERLRAALREILYRLEPAYRYMEDHYDIVIQRRGGDVEEAFIIARSAVLAEVEK